MANVAAALRELDRMEGILRTRYHYPHPIFGHIEATRGYLAEEPEAPIVTSDEEPGTDSPAQSVVVDVDDTNAHDQPIHTAVTHEPTAKAPKARRKRGNA